MIRAIKHLNLPTVFTLNFHIGDPVKELSGVFGSMIAGGWTLMIECPEHLKNGQRAADVSYNWKILEIKVEVY